MLTAIMLDGFRGFAEPTRVTLGALTLLAGVNSAGKSSGIHALLSLIQSEQQPDDAANLRLSGEWVDIGSFQQALNYSRQGESRQFAIGVSSRIGENELDMVLTLGEPGGSGGDIAKIERVEACVNDMELAYESASATGESYYVGATRMSPSSPWTMFGKVDMYPWHARNPSHRRALSHSPATVLYLSAFRDGPRKLYPQRRSKLGPLLGAMGEYVAETLFTRRNEETNILPEPGPPRLLGAALEAWWARIFGGDYAIRAEAAEALGFTLSLDTPSAENLRLTQVGTGLSQVLPVIVLCLCSKPGDLVIVESPEVQLHPSAQHRLMDLFIALTRAGRQVILETHSDHVIHATQLAVKHGKISPEEVAMRFFAQEEGVARVEPVPIDAQGRMTKQPLGFVDQVSADLLLIR
jgi:predicted ATPase